LQNGSFRDRHVLVLAGLFHDIGKVIRRKGVGKRHEILSTEFIKDYSELFKYVGINTDLLEKLILCHHYERLPDKYKNLCDSGKHYLNILRKADRTSAPERYSARAKMNYTNNCVASTQKLVSPLWVKHCAEKHSETRTTLKNIADTIGNSNICYEPVPLTSISRYGKNIDVVRTAYRAVECSSVTGNTSLKSMYDNMYRELQSFMDKLQELSKHDLLTPDTLVSTLANYLRYALLLVPDDICWSEIPDTSLATHSILTAALSYAYLKGKDRIRLAILDLSGIQAYISSLASLKGALRQLRGRSLLLQLVMRAAANYILDKLGLPPTNQVLVRGDNALFILPDEEGITERFENALREINIELHSIFHGDVYLAGAISEPFTPEYTLPWDPDHGLKGFSKAVIEIGRELSRDKQRRLARIADIIAKRQEKILNHNNEPVMCELCGKTLLKDEAVNLLCRNLEQLRTKFTYFDSILREKLGEKPGEHKEFWICPACMLAHIAGSTAANLEFILEIKNKELAVALYEELMGNEEFRLPTPPEGFEYSVIPFPRLERTYILVSIKPGEIIEDQHEAWEKLRDFLVKFLLTKILGKYLFRRTHEVVITILRVNDPPSMLPPEDVQLSEKLIEGVEIKYGFGNIFLNFTNEATKELDDLAKKDGEEMTYLAWIKTDIDHMGLTGLYLSGSIGRYITMAELVNFYTNMIGHRVLDYIAEHIDGGKTRLRDNSIIVFSGGDDTFVISRFPEGLYYLYHYGSWFRDFFGTIKDGDKEVQPITLSAGLYMSEADYPAYLSYREAIERLETAKYEGRNRVDISFLELKPGTEENQSLLPTKTIEWKTYYEIIRASTDKQLLDWIRDNRVLSFKIMTILKNIAETTHMILADKPEPEYYRRLAEYIIAYTYLYKKMENIHRIKPYEDTVEKIAANLGIKPSYPDQYVDLLANNEITEIYRSATTFYRLLQITLLRLREQL